MSFAFMRARASRQRSSVWYRGSLEGRPRPHLHCGVPMPSPRRPEVPGRVTYSISDLAREFALTTRAIRFYEDCGL